MIPTIQTDKLLHSFWCTLLFFGFAIPLSFFLNKDIALYISYFVCFIIAAVKEIIHDWRMEKGKPEWLDFWYSILFPSLVIILIKIIEWQ